MDIKGWIVLPKHGKPQELSQAQSYPKLVELIQDVDAERGHMLTDKQANALQAVIRSLIDVGACVTYYDDE
jgi:hypothetical protein